MIGFLYSYYSLMVFCFGVSLFYLRFTLVKWLAALLLTSIAAEVAAEIVGTAQHKHYAVYHFFSAAEYTIITLTLRSQTGRPWLRKIMLLSLAVYWPAWFYISFFVQRLTDFPGIGIGIEAVLIIAWSLLTLVYIEPISELSIFRFPVFWTALGFLVYFSGTVALNTVYNYLRHTQTQRAQDLFDVINNISNCLLYIFLTIGIVCHQGPTKSSAP